MAKWKVWNRHPDGLTHREKFREEMIVIPAGDYVLMDYEDAVLFRGQYFPIKTNPDGTHSRDSMKVIHLEREDVIDAKESSPKYISQLDGKEFGSESELNAHLEKFKEKIFQDETLDRELAAESRRKPGRPSKEKTA